jgi:nicotinamide-nucleotide amidase
MPEIYEFRDLPQLAVQFLEACKAHNIMAATAESCTGGLVAATLTDIPGSSAVVDRGFVTYSNDAKVDMLGVSKATLYSHGAVSRETALEMAIGALARSRAGIALSVTGVAGPDGGTPERPVGLVWFGVAHNARVTVAEHRIFDNRGRDHIRRLAVRTALELGLRALGQVDGAP